MLFKKVHQISDFEEVLLVYLVSNIQHLNQRVLLYILSYVLADSCSCSSNNDPIRIIVAGLIVVFSLLHVDLMKKCCCKQTATTAQTWTLQAAAETVVTLLLKNNPKEGV